MRAPEERRGLVQEGETEDERVRQVGGQEPGGAGAVGIRGLQVEKKR